MTRVGYIGVGTMGKHMAFNALRGGFGLVVHDLQEEPLRELAELGATVASSARDVARQADIVALVVRDDDAVESVVSGDDGVLAGADAGKVIVVHTTVHPRTMQQVEAAARARGVGVIDAQMSGGEHGARDRTLTYMVGGDLDLFERCRPLFETSGTNIFHVGPLGTGAAMKLVQQVVFCLNRLAAHEGFTLAAKAGVDLKMAQQVLQTTPGQSHAVDYWLERYFVDPDGGAFSESAQLYARILHTVTPALELARDLGAGLPAAALAQQLFPEKRRDDATP